MTTPENHNHSECKMMSYENLTVTKTIFGGKGLCQAPSGKIVISDRGLPGDVISGVIHKRKKRYDSIVHCKITAASPLRRPNPCRFGERCGGCSWLDIDLEQQSQWKQQYLVDAVLRPLKNNAPEQLTEFFQADPDLNYRRRIRIKGRFRNQQLELGFFAPGSHQLIALDHCLVAHPSINHLIKALTTLKFNASGADFSKSFSLDILLVETNEKPGLLVTVLEGRFAANLLPCALTDLGVLWWGTTIQALKAPYFLFERHQDLSYFTKPGQFQQCHREQNLVLKTLVEKIVAETHPQRILDLYCGSGNLSLALSRASYDVVGVESCPLAVAAAQHNLSKNHLTGDYRMADCQRFLELTDQSFDLIILDPPRQGVGSAMRHIASLGADVVLYVACDPVTMARDLKILVDQGYFIEQLYGFDFFPHTPHVEALTVIKTRD